MNFKLCEAEQKNAALCAVCVWVCIFKKYEVGEVAIAARGWVYYVFHRQFQLLLYLYFKQTEYLFKLFLLDINLTY